MKKLYFTIMFAIPIWALEVIAQVASSPAASPSAAPQGGAILVGGAASGQWLLDIVAKFPKLSVLLFVVGGLRITLKPLFAFGHKFFQGWGLVAWDQAESNIESSKIMMGIFFALDYLGSIKVPVTDNNAPTEPPKT